MDLGLNDVWIGLGANEGDSIATVGRAMADLGQLALTRVTQRSQLRLTAPVGPPQPAYVNGVVRAKTGLSPMELWQALKGLEVCHGRGAGPRWGPRRLDLDLLVYEDRVIEDPMLQVPHPHLHERRFVLEPMCDIDPSHRHPTLDRTIGELLQALL